MTVHNYSNTASQATLDSPLNSSANTFAVSNFTGYPQTPFYVLMDRDTSSSELMEVTTVAGSTLTVQRGQGGTASTSHSAGAVVEHVIPAAVPQAVEQHIEATANVHGITGSLIGADSTGTLSNKTFEGAFVHTYSASQPSSPEAGFVVNADNSIARDGFVVDGDGANTDRRGFLLTQGGAERVEVFHDGTVRVTPSGSAARPGIESTTSMRTSDMDVTDDLTVGGDAVISGSAQAVSVSTGNLTTSGTATVGGATSVQALTASQTVTANGSGTGLSVANAASVGSLTVNSGNVVLASSTSRVQFPASPSGSGTAEGQVRYRNTNLEAWNGSAWIGMRPRWNEFPVNSSAPTCWSGNPTVTLGTGNFTDPGWPYSLIVQASCECGFFAARADLQVRVGSSSGALLCAARPDDRGDNWGGQLVTPMGSQSGFTGATTIWVGLVYVSGGDTVPSTNFRNLFAIAIPDGF